MRLFRAALALALAATLSGAPPLLAESAGRVSGQVVDAAGRPLPSLRVELIKAFRGRVVGVPLQVNVTDGRGAWSFGGVPDGDYVVRAVYRDRTSGVPVSVVEASEAAGVLIAAPSLPRPERLSQGQGAGPATTAGGFPALAVAGLVAAAAAAAIIVVVRSDKS